MKHKNLQKMLWKMQMLQDLQWDGCRKETDYYEKSYGSWILRIILGALKLVLGLARIILLLFAMVARIFLSFVRMGTF